jgi:hypothetical protein
LARQFYRTGQWRRGVVRRMPETANARYLAPPAVVLALVGGAALAVAGKRIGWAAPAGYAAAVISGSAVTGRDLPRGAAARLPIVFATMHLAWGAGFLLSPKDLIPAPPPRV